MAFGRDIPGYIVSGVDDDIRDKKTTLELLQMEYGGSVSMRILTTYFRK